jgi:hypothetical protein
VGIIKDVRSAKSVRDALGYWLGPPGWSPDGSRDSSKILKKRWMERRRAERVEETPDAAAPAE